MAGAAAGLALTASLTGCKADSGQDAKPSGSATPEGRVHLTAAQEALSKSATETGDLKSFRATMTTSTVVSGKTTDLKGDLAFQLQPKPAMKFDVPAIKTGDSSAAGFNEVLVDNTIYLKIPALAKTAGKPWVSFSLDQLGKATGVDVKAMEDQGHQADPALNAKMLTASKDVHKVGKETVDGVSTTHYKGTIALSEGLSKLNAEQKTQAQKIFSQTGLDKLKFDTWIDGKQLPRKLTLATPADAKLKFKTAMNYKGFNEPVSITAPPQSEVADGMQLKGLPSASPS
ncbi:hypothetical protein [Actinomadura sp. DC4]|uniref:hypothetical protein n=1 Tax=Actinomadura sp. DC4 TaxID=3055069 RepID=UPI0025B03286|nr:hypothetical protein [Actinomadura sp. DC4]MDN3359527.1 hypothetical protein [Actinomadura sp. DC4]